MRRLLCWCVAFGLMVVGVGADPVPAGLHLNWRFNTSSGVETGTWNVTFNVSRNPNCSDIIFSSTRNLSSTSAGDLDVYLYGEAANFTPATHLCLWRNQSVLYGIFNLTRFPRNVSPSQVMDDAPLNLTNLTATNLTADFFAANFSFLVTSRVQSWFAPLTDATLDLGNATLRFRDLYLSRNITDGTVFVTVQNLSDAANVTLDYRRINATLGANASALTNNSPANFSPFDVDARYVRLENDTALQSVLWFRTFGVTRGSWFWDNATGRYALGTYTEAGAWDGYAFWLTATTKAGRIYGSLTLGGNLSGDNGTLFVRNATFTGLEGNLSCANITGAASNLCTLTSLGNPFNQSLNTSDDVAFGNLTVRGNLSAHGPTKINSSDTRCFEVVDQTADTKFRIDCAGSQLFAYYAVKPTASAAIDLGSSGLLWRDLYLSRNITDATFWVTVQNVTESARYTLNVTRIGLLLNATGSHNVSLSQVASLVNRTNLTNVSALPAEFSLRNWTNDANYTNTSAQADYWVNASGGNMTGPLNMTGNAIGNVSNISLGPHMITWNLSCLILLANGTGQTNHCV